MLVSASEAKAQFGPDVAPVRAVADRMVAENTRDGWELVWREEATLNDDRPTLYYDPDNDDYRWRRATKYETFISGTKLMIALVTMHPRGTASLSDDVNNKVHTFGERSRLTVDDVYVTGGVLELLWGNSAAPFHSIGWQATIDGIQRVERVFVTLMVFKTRCKSQRDCSQT